MNITFSIFAHDKYDSHKCVIDPSVAVNPPAFQYFSGVKQNYQFMNDDGKATETDNRFKEMVGWVELMLASEEYPTPSICSRTTAKRTAKIIVRQMLNELEKAWKKGENTVEITQPLVTQIRQLSKKQLDIYYGE